MFCDRPHKSIIERGLLLHCIGLKFDSRIPVQLRQLTSQVRQKVHGGARRSDGSAEIR
jgi:hypothetical protein